MVGRLLPPRQLDGSGPPIPIPRSLEQAKDIIAQCGGLVPRKNEDPFYVLYEKLRTVEWVATKCTKNRKDAGLAAKQAAEHIVDILHYWEGSSILLEVHLLKINDLARKLHILACQIASEDASFFRPFASVLREIRDCKGELLELGTSHAVSDTALDTIRFTSRVVAEGVGDTSAAPIKSLAIIVGNLCSSIVAARKNVEIANDLDQLTKLIKLNILAPHEIEQNLSRQIQSVLKHLGSELEHFRRISKRRDERSRIKKLVGANTDGEQIERFHKRILEALQVLQATELHSVRLTAMRLDEKLNTVHDQVERMRDISSIVLSTHNMADKHEQSLSIHSFTMSLVLFGLSA